MQRNLIPDDLRKDARPRQNHPFIFNIPKITRPILRTDRYKIRRLPPIIPPRRPNRFRPIFVSIFRHTTKIQNSKNTYQKPTPTTPVETGRALSHGNIPCLISSCINSPKTWRRPCPSPQPNRDETPLTHQNTHITVL